jgi:hypothetical protein
MGRELVKYLDVAKCQMPPDSVCSGFVGVWSYLAKLKTPETHARQGCIGRYMVDPLKPAVI